jgi:hypothetical protein
MSTGERLTAREVRRRTRYALWLLNRRITVGLFGQSNPEPVEIVGRPLRCEICDHDQFWRREAMLNTAVATFFNFD